jgi:Tol biopolymer transport system component
LKRLPDGEPVQLTHESGRIFGPVFTSDGTRVAYSVVTVGRSTFTWDTFTVPIAGGEPERLLPNASGLSYIGPHEVMYSEFQTGIHLGIATSLEDRAQHRDVYLPAHERGMAHFSHLSPDRRSVLVVEMGGDGNFQRCRLVPFDGGNSGFAVGPEGGVCLSAAWSPDGRWMYFSAQTAKGMHLWRQRYPDGAPQQITNFPGDEDSVMATSDGMSLLASVGIEQSELWIHDARGERRLTSEGVVRDPWLSTDGHRAYYVAARRTGGDHEDELRRIDVDTDRPTMLFNGFNVLNFDVSGDERWIAFARLNAGVSEIWIAPLDRSTGPRKLVTGGDDVHFDRENRVYFRRIEGRVNYLERIDLDGTASTRPSEDPILDLDSVSPDGKFAVVARAFAGMNGRFLLPLSKSPPVMIDRGWGRARWSHDGGTLFIEVGFREHLERRGRTRVVRLGSDGLPTEILDPQPANAILIDRAVETLGIGDDPDTYAFVATTGSKNIYRIPLR